MAIEKSLDPRTRQELIFATGVVEGVYLNKLKEVRSYGDGWTPTHSMQIKVDGDRISLGLTDKENVEEIKAQITENGKTFYTPLLKGMEVSVEITQEQSGKYMNNNSKISKVFITDKSGAVANAPAPQTGGTHSGGYQKRDNTGMKIGHLRNCVENLLGKKAFDDQDKYIKLATSFQQLTDELVAKVKAEVPDVSDYDAGAIAGRAVLSASHNSGSTSFKGVKEYAYTALSTQLDGILKDIVSGESKVQPEPKQEPVKQPDPEPSMDFDDDIPF